MASRSSHNKNNAGVKRILQEARELATDPSTDYHAAPLEDDIFEWHCTMRGPTGTEFEGGIYHFRIQLPSEYPFRPPSIMLLTPNGRFELNTKICISFTNYHEELWQPAWGVRTAIIALQGFFPLKGEAAVGVGAVEYPPQERKRLAKLSRDWRCFRCEQTNLELLPDVCLPVETTGLSDHNRDHAATKLGAAVNPQTFSCPPPINTSDSSNMLQSASSSSPLPSTPTLADHHVTTLFPQSTLVQRRLDRPSVQSRSRPPLVLDGAIAICLTMLVAILWKRIF
ncbi:UBC-like protein [Ramaria rubella]|nr:UBC-like protein [Ramaria rubella]